jgi:hypothetical protein
VQHPPSRMVLKESAARPRIAPATISCRCVKAAGMPHRIRVATSKFGQPICCSWTSQLLGEAGPLAAGLKAQALLKNVANQAPNAVYSLPVCNGYKVTCSMLVHWLKLGSCVKACRSWELLLRLTAVQVRISAFVGQVTTVRLLPQFHRPSTGPCRCRGKGENARLYLRLMLSIYAVDVSAHTGVAFF